jgi:hypothetical protein
MEEFIRTSEHGGFLINEYKGTYSLNSAWESDDGTVRQNWALKQKGKDKYAEKATPIKVELGDRDHAIAALTKALQSIKGTTDIAPPMEDVPF